MNKALTITVVCCLGLSFAPGCAQEDHSAEVPTTAWRSNLNAPTLTPVPFDVLANEEIFHGNTVELLFLDALVGCSNRGLSGTTPDANALIDEYAEAAWSKAEGMKCKHWLAIGSGPTTLDVGMWWGMRGDVECNVDPTTRQPKAATITLNPTLLNDHFPNNVLTDLVTPSINLCIAQRLRAVSPGASGGEALLLSDAEQRELLAVTQERAQRAMLGLALLGVTFMPDYAVVPSATPQDQRIVSLKAWAADPTNFTSLQALGNDLSAAIELHTMVSTEFAELLARSASAKSPRGGSATSDAEFTWGKGSWRARTLAALFGGHPLSHEADQSSPWVDPAGYSSVIPLDDYFPYAKYQIRRPEVHRFGALASMLPELPLKLQLEGANCGTIKTSDTGSDLYDRVELAVESKACDPSCTPQSPPQQETEYRLFTRHGIRREHAIGYAEFLSDTLDPICRSTVPAQTASMNLQGKLSGSFPAVVLMGTSGFAPKLVEQRISEFTRFINWRMPDQVWTTARAEDQGFANYADPSSASAYSDQAHLGSVSALAAVREALHSMARLDTGSSTIYSTFAHHAAKMVGLIGAGAGQRSFSLRPALMSADELDLAWYADEDLPTPGLEGYPWTVDVVNPATDTFWAADDSGTIKIVAVTDKPWAGNLALYPDSRIFNETIASIVEPLAASSSGPYGVAEKDTTNAEEAAGIVHHRARLFIKNVWEGCPSGWECWPYSPGTPFRRFTFIARKAIGDGKPSYRLLAADLAPTVWDQRHGEYIGAGGRLGGIAEKVLTLDPNNPAQPKYDGFGLPMSWIPPSDPVLFGASPGESAVAHYLDTAENAAKEASGAVESAMTTLLEQQQADMNTAAAQQEAQKLNALEEESLCGDNNKSCADGVAIVEQPMLEWDEAWYPATMAQDQVQHHCAVDSIPGSQGDADDAVQQIMKEEYGKFLTAVETNQVADLPGYLQTIQQTSEYYRKQVDPLLTMLYGCELASAAGLGQAELKPKLAPEDVAAAGMLHCQALQVLESVAGPNSGGPGTTAMVGLAKAVATKRNETMVPSFGEYSGGKLQAAFIQQWSALRSLRDLANEYLKAVDVAIARILQARATVNASTNIYHQSCNPTKAREANRACFSFTLYMPSFNPGPLIAYNQHCAELAEQVGPAMMAAHTAQAEASMTVASYASRFTDAARDVQLSSANVQQLAREADLAKKRNDIEADLVAETPVTTSGLYRRFHSYDLWRAKAMVESARRYAVLARRAVEAHYAVNLSEMKASEPFVASPSTWADEVYAYDLSLPAAVGLAIGQATPGGIYPNKVADYVGNLKRFKEGYAIARPTAVAHDDTEIISIPGPYTTRTVDNRTVADETAGRWELFCPNLGVRGSWRPVVYAKFSADPDHENSVVSEPGWYDSASSETCNEPSCQSAGTCPAPTAARISFYLDAWGRLDGLIANKPYELRHNNRWNRLVVNLVGTAVKDCTKSTDPLTCYAESFVRYRLRHVGPAWVSAYDQQWHLFSIPFGAMEGAKALAIEQFLDPLTNSWGKSYVDAAARTEFADRPTTGAYLLELALGPEVVLQHVDRLQILASNSYWVQQQ